MSCGKKYKSLHWEKASNGEIPEGAVQAGWDQNDTIYVARGHHNGDVIPGKLVPTHGVCYVPYGGEEIKVQDYEVLCNRKECELKWKATQDGEIPDGALQGGKTDSGEDLYIGRTSHEGTMTTGKVHPSHGCLYIPYAGSEIRSSNYEILVCPRLILK